MCSLGREHLSSLDSLQETMFIAAPIAAALNSQRNHFVDLGVATGHSGIMPKSATLWVEDWESMEEHRCFADLIHFLVERGAQARSYG
jgi:hypothetical protein